MGTIPNDRDTFIVISSVLQEKQTSWTTRTKKEL
jgi:hypothetical protein